MRALYSFKKHKSIEVCKPFDINDANEIVVGMDFFKLGEPLSLISNALTKVYIINYTKEYRIAICLPTNCIGKYNSTDEETTLQMLVCMTENLQSLPAGVHYTFFDLGQHIDQQNTTSMESIWAFDQPWVGDGDYIAVKITKGKEWKPRADMSFVYQQADSNNIKIKEVYYGMSLHKQIDILRHCRGFVTETGGHVALALTMRVPIMLVECGYIEGYIGPDWYVNSVYGSGNIGVVPSTNIFEQNVKQRRVEDVVSICDRGYNENILIDFLTKDRKQVNYQYAFKNKQLLLVADNETINQRVMMERKHRQDG